MTVQLLGHGNVILMSASATDMMNVNYVISDEEFVRMVRELVEKAKVYEDSALQQITFVEEK
jgi:hypothetical protein